MDLLHTVTVIIATIIAGTLYAALHRQTKRADRAEAQEHKLGAERNNIKILAHMLGEERRDLAFQNDAAKTEIAYLREQISALETSVSNFVALGDRFIESNRTDGGAS